MGLNEYRCYNCNKLLFMTNDIVSDEFELSIKCPRCKVMIKYPTGGNYGREEKGFDGHMLQVQDQSNSSKGC